MRCLTVAEALQALGHEVAIMGEVEGVDWLDQHLNSTGIERITCERDVLSAAHVADSGADRLVVDSYWIDPADVAAVNALVPTMAIVDNTTRGIRADWYVDHNQGAEEREWPATQGRVLAGSRYALVRNAFTMHRRESGWMIPGRDSHVVAFMGGTDPSETMTSVAASVAAALPDLRFTVVTTSSQVDRVAAAVKEMPHATVLGPSRNLPELLGTADAVVSAAGTSAWDVCTMGRPVVLVGVVENQSAGLARVLERGIATGIDATVHGTEAVGRLLADLLDDAPLRESLVRRANRVFDGQGSRRVADALTSELRDDDARS